MAKNKLNKFADMEEFPHVFQYPYAVFQEKGFDMKGKWNEQFFKNNNPIILELGCGKGEYTVGLGELFPKMNFVGVDIKGARMWTGAKDSHEKGMENIAFLRTHIEMITEFFGENEVSEIWITFPDPQMKRVNKRMTSIRFLEIYSQILEENGLIHLKTDSNFMYTYTHAVVVENKLPILFDTDDLYNSDFRDKVRSIQTFYEQQWLARGLTIKYLKFECEARQNWIEPDIEIEEDSYRSFGRNQRSSL